MRAFVGWPRAERLVGLAGWSRPTTRTPPAMATSPTARSPQITTPSKTARPGQQTASTQGQPHDQAVGDQRKLSRFPSSQVKAAASHRVQDAVPVRCAVNTVQERYTPRHPDRMVGFGSESRNRRFGGGVVLRISNGHSANYLTGAVAAGRENYYTGAVAAGEPPGRWCGRGAEALGLAGEVDAQDMTALYEHFSTRAMRPSPIRSGGPTPTRWATPVGGICPRRRSTPPRWRWNLTPMPNAARSCGWRRGRRHARTSRSWM